MTPSLWIWSKCVDIYSTPAGRSAATCGSRIIWYLLPVEMLGSEVDVCSWFPLASLF